MPETTFSIRDSSGFRVIGEIKLTDNTVSSASHELRYMIGWVVDSVHKFTKHNGWKMVEVCKSTDT